MRLAVFGSGPSGLMAAWAALQCGAQVTIFDPSGLAGVQTRINLNAGVFLLHDRCDIIPLTGTERAVRFGVIGDKYTNGHELVQMYRRKVYGPQYEGPVSLQEYAGTTREYDGLRAERLLFDILHTMIREGAIGTEHGITEDIDLYLQDFDRIIVTAPAWAAFGIKNWHTTFAPYMSPIAVHEGDAPLDESYVLYAPQPDVPWYRVSGVFGRFVMERPYNQAQPEDRILYKPTTPPPFIESHIAELEAGGQVLFAGRFARWEKGIEQHAVYYGTLRWLKK